MENHRIIVSTGSKAVDQMAQIPITGNISNKGWYKHIKKSDSGKTDMLAVAIYSDIVYNHRPTPVYDESGAVVGYKKKFFGDRLQKSYDDYAEMYDVTKRQVKAAVDTLVEKNLIERTFENVILKGGQKLTNVMYVVLNVDELLKITDINTPKSISSCSEPSYIIKEQVPQNIEIPLTEKCRTNTDTNTNINTNTYIQIIPSNPKVKESSATDDGRMNDEAVTREIIAENIELDSLISEQPDCESEYLEYVEVMVDLICHNKRPMKIRGNEYPASVIASRMMKLKREHIERVSEVFSAYAGQITDFYKHCAATLFNSYYEVNNLIKVDIKRTYQLHAAS